MPPDREWRKPSVEPYGVLAVVVTGALLAERHRARRGFPHDVTAGAAFVAAVALAIAWGVLHTTDDSTATTGAHLALAGLIVVGPVAAVLDGVLRGRQRRRVDQTGPALPRARVAR